MTHRRLCLGVAALLVACPGGGSGGGSGKKDGSAVDAGSSLVPVGGACATGSECESGYCDVGYACAPAGCGDGEQGVGESGVDCGGQCGACLGDKCTTHTDCQGGFCDEGTCGTATCADGIKNGAETGVDCGGSACPQCADGELCIADTHCVGGWCREGFCATPDCSDRARSGAETDVDCGGPCPPCEVGRACTDGGDCATGACAGGACVEPPATCDDGEMNGTESDVDCGGVECPGCSFGAVCAAHADCVSGLCEGAVCSAPPTCSDNEKNGAESDVDCGGGACPGCATGKFCSEHSDCLSVTCLFGACDKPACDDSLLNGQETDLDCGGKQCDPCADGSACQTETDCVGGGCVDFTCCSLNACGECGELPEEVCDGVDNDCNGAVDDGVLPTEACPKQGDECWQPACQGEAGWVCVLDEAANETAEKPEKSCDGIDNDCDGVVDEPAVCTFCGTTVTAYAPGGTLTVSEDFMALLPHSSAGGGLHLFRPTLAVRDGDQALLVDAYSGDTWDIGPKPAHSPPSIAGGGPAESGTHTVFAAVVAGTPAKLYVYTLDTEGELVEDFVDGASTALGLTPRVSDNVAHRAVLYETASGVAFRVRDAQAWLAPQIITPTPPPTVAMALFGANWEAAALVWDLGDGTIQVTDTSPDEGDPVAFDGHSPRLPQQTALEESAVPILFRTGEEVFFRRKLGNGPNHPLDAPTFVGTGTVYSVGVSGSSDWVVAVAQGDELRLRSTPHKNPKAWYAYETVVMEDGADVLDVNVWVQKYDPHYVHMATLVDAPGGPEIRYSAVCEELSTE